MRGIFVDKIRRPGTSVASTPFFSRAIGYVILAALVSTTASARPLEQILRATGVRTGLVSCEKLLVSEETWRTRNTISRTWSMEAGSMLPTIGPSDLLVGIEVKIADITRGDIVIFLLPTDNKTEWVKRIIGLPEDQVQMKSGRLYLNDHLVPRTPVEDFVLEDKSGGARHVPQFVETLGVERQYRIVELTDRGPLDNTPIFKVPLGHYFILGDNRDNSLDSRVPGHMGIGVIPAKNILGLAACIVPTN